jgi:O-antigen ligase
LCFALALFIFLHGLISRGLNLTHYYWVANALLLWAAWGQGMATQWAVGDTMDIKRETAARWRKGIALLYKGISLLALLESLIVCCQQAGILASKNPLYACTGTWENPNVTAMFLSMAAYAALQGTGARSKPSASMRLEAPPKNGQPAAAYIIVALILTAIVLLHCRTAFLVFALFIAGHYWSRFSVFVKSKTRLPGSMVTVMAGAFMITLILLLAFGVKQSSTHGRIRIWETSIRLMMQKPLTGQGFGQFEKQYNLFTANEALPDNDHVNMPYNDFLELGIEGGVGAVALWAAFLIALWIQHRKRGYSVLPIIALLFIQCTNFGFQALPVFALFLLYAAIPPEAAWQEYPQAIPPAHIVAERHKTILTGSLLKQAPAGFRIVGMGCLPAIALLMIIHQADLAGNFYRRNKITQYESDTEAIGAYTSLAPALHNFASYHLYFGNAYLQLNQYRPAISQYLQGLASSSSPEMLVKCGYCYQQLHLYDSSRYYYTMAKNMQPYKFGPRLALLKLYQQQGDKPMMISEAQTIINMPVKVENSQVAGIKNYAHTILEKEKQ